MTEPLHGVVVVDKPVGPTSFAIVRQARRATGARKIGHGGTLDPLASGVLPICFGEATKLAQFLLDADKEYQATIAFGAETDTYDAGGVVTARRPAGHLTGDQVRRALEQFRGPQSQVPPMFSALKRAGRPLYAYARAGETVERAPRQVHLHAIELTEFVPGADDLPPARGAETDGGLAAGAPHAQVFIRCSKGTYVRSLAHDLGQALGTGAHLTALRRTRSGPFGLDRAISPDALGLDGLPVLSLADALAHLPLVVVCEDVARDLVHGKPVIWARTGTAATAEPTGPAATVQEGALIRILAPDGALLTVARCGHAEELVRTIRVFRPLSSGAGDTAPPIGPGGTAIPRAS